MHVAYADGCNVRYRTFCENAAALILSRSPSPSLHTYFYTSVVICTDESKDEGGGKRWRNTKKSLHCCGGDG